MRLRNIIYLGAEITDKETFDKLPTDLQVFLKEQNGLIAFNGGLQINSCSETPDWHSIKYYWTGDKALHKTYDSLTQTDIPFGLDCVGDHFILRDNQVFRLSGETGDLENMEINFSDFLKLSNENPDEFLMLGPLKQFEKGGQRLAPGQLLSVYPFFCMKESANGISVSNVPTKERVEFLKSLYMQLKDIEPGQQVKIKVE
jgi:hypothetical protein